MTEHTTITRGQLAQLIDDTLLEPEVTDDDVARLAKQAEQLSVHAICISPSRLPLAPGVLAGGIGVVAVAGFPSGAHLASVKVAEAAAAVSAGATEVDMLIDLGLAMDDRWKPVTAEVAAVRAAIGPQVTLKVIIETAVIGPGRRRHRAGGRRDSRRGRRPARGEGGRGIHTTEQALAMIAADATRIGASHTAAILNGVHDE